MPEQKTIKENSSYALYILPLVQLYVLEILSSRHIDTMRAQRALDELQVLVHHDQGKLMSVPRRDISCKILGICQQKKGNLQAALYSKLESLRQDQFNLFNKVRTATIQRIQDLHLST